MRSQAGAWERVVLLLVGFLAQTSFSAEPAASLTYNRDIRPILADNCFRCHGADSAARKADLRLDQRAIAIDSGALTPGQPEDSELLRRILSDDPDEMMPPPDTRQALSAEQKVKLQRWIADGAAYEEHWSFVPPVKAELPQVDLAAFATSSFNATPTGSFKKIAPKLPVGDCCDTS